MGEQDDQRDIIADAGGDAHLKGASVEDQDCRQVHHDVRDCQSDGTDDGKVPIIVEGHKAVEHPDQVHGRQAKGDSNQIPSGLREKFRVVPGSTQSACDGSGEYDEKEHKRRSKSCGKNTGQGEDLLGLFCFAGAEKSCEAAAGACDYHCANDGEGDHERVDDSESGDGVHAEELADHYAVDHGAHGRREREQDKGGQLYIKGVSDDASVGADCVSNGHLCSL